MVLRLSRPSECPEPTVNWVLAPTASNTSQTILSETPWPDPRPVPQAAPLSHSILWPVEIFLFHCADAPCFCHPAFAQLAHWTGNPSQRVPYHPRGRVKGIFPILLRRPQAHFLQRARMSALGLWSFCTGRTGAGVGGKAASWKHVSRGSTSTTLLSLSLSLSPQHSYAPQNLPLHSCLAVPTPRDMAGVVIVAAILECSVCTLTRGHEELHSLEG